MNQKNNLFILFNFILFFFMARYTKRLQRELKDFQSKPPPGIEIESCDDITKFVKVFL